MFLNWINKELSLVPNCEIVAVFSLMSKTNVYPELRTLRLKSLKFPFFVNIMLFLLSHFCTCTSQFCTCMFITICLTYCGRNWNQHFCPDVFISALYSKYDDTMADNNLPFISFCQYLRRIINKIKIHSKTGISFIRT